MRNYKVLSKEIDDFIFSSRDFLKPPKLKAYPGEEKGPRTNIIFLTTRCNFDCEYCYEKEKREDLSYQKDVTKEEIDLFLEEIAEREKGITSVVVLFGGEPFLKFELMTYLVEKALSMKKDGGFSFSTITNGSKLQSDHQVKDLQLMMDYCKERHSDFNLAISWDGTGNKRRPSGLRMPTSYLLDQCFDLLEAYNIPYDISYTMHAGNIKVFTEDISKFCQKRSPRRIKISWAESDIEEFHSKETVALGKELMDRWSKPFYEALNIPICNHSCGACVECESGQRIGNAYFSPTKGLKYSDVSTKDDFDLF